MSINLQTPILAQTVRPEAASGFVRVKDVERA